MAARFHNNEAWCTKHRRPTFQGRPYRLTLPHGSCGPNSSGGGCQPIRAPAEVVDLLLKARAHLHGADMINATAAHWASLANNAPGLRLMFEARADLQRRNFVGMNVFEVACSNGAVDTMAEVLAHFPSTDLRLGLHYALLFYGGYEDPIRYLIAAKANLNEPFRIQIEQTAWWILLQIASARHLGILRNSVLAFLSARLAV